MQYDDKLANHSHVGRLVDAHYTTVFPNTQVLPNSDIKGDYAMGHQLLYRGYPSYRRLGFAHLVHDCILGDFNALLYIIVVTILCMKRVRYSTHTLYVRIQN